MESVGVAELKAKLSQYLAKVRAGEEIAVTERGRPVAKIVRIQPRDRDDAEWQRMVALEREGLIKLPTEPLPEDFFRRPRPLDPGGLVLKALLEEREEGR
jgi:prevent-host-death family protein